MPGGGDYTTEKIGLGPVCHRAACAGIFNTGSVAIMATPEVQNSQSANYDAPTNQADNSATAEVAERPETVTGDSWFADYRPSWWALPTIGGAMLLAMLVIYMGLRYEQDAVAWGGIALFGLTTCALLASFVRYAWLLACDLFGRQ